MQSNVNEMTPLMENSSKSQSNGPFHDVEKSLKSKKLTIIAMYFLLVSSFTYIIIKLIATRSEQYSAPTTLGGAWSSKADPFSVSHPLRIGFNQSDRPYSSRPGPVFGSLLDKNVPLPTNTWYENFLLGKSTRDPENKVFQVPYILDTAGPIIGVRTHPAHVMANDRSVMMTYELENGMTVGAVEKLSPQHRVRSQGVPSITKLAIELEWSAVGVNVTENPHKGPYMRSPIVRGAPYTSMIYLDATPRIFVERSTNHELTIDNGKIQQTLVCGLGKGNFSAVPVKVQREIKVQFDTSDMTWLIFISEPMEFECSYSGKLKEIDMSSFVPGVVSTQVNENFFELRATKPLSRGMVRIAMSNNCTTGQEAEYCDRDSRGIKLARDQTIYENLLRDHAEVYPTAKADVEFTFPVKSEEEEELRLIFNWSPACMSFIKDDMFSLVPTPGPKDPFSQANIANELMMYAIPHHQERLRRIVGSSNLVQNGGCTPTIHGMACPVLGASWSMLEHLHRTSFHSSHAVKEEMLPDLRAAIRKDLLYSPPDNYMRGAGDTYFSGKMLAKLARILIIAEEIEEEETDLFFHGLNTLRAGVEIWLNGSSETLLLYDPVWGGIVSCGCDYDGETGKCRNSYPNCPGIEDAGSNFGAGFYNDHHYHYGYHIYAAAVVSKFDHQWARKFYERVLALVRDIANPSEYDPHFTSFRHKDWYLGFSWASGIVTIAGKPYPNGRNQESSSEAISAYEGVALFGAVMGNVFGGSANLKDVQLAEAAGRIRDMGRLLQATETRSAITYWHVQDVDAIGVARVYPVTYRPKVVGMIWSMLAQEQTWFGNEPWKSYGIQLMPITVASEARDTVSWVKEMVPIFNESCSQSAGCAAEGWSILVYTSLATIGEWRTAWEGVNRLDDSVYLMAGGNGHSRSNTLWYIATRPDV